MARYTSFIAAALLLALIAAPAAEAASRRELAQARNAAPANKSNNKSKSSSRGPTGKRRFLWPSPIASRRAPLPYFVLTIFVLP
jgi:hypothetical protein